VTIAVNIESRAKQKWIHIFIEDNGVGLNSNQTFGLGLPGMKERIVGLDGKINFTSQDGTTIEAWIPIK
ncbi:MAG: ATP-binding protein, partial [Methylophilaceae bacterium]